MSLVQWGEQEGMDGQEGDMGRRRSKGQNINNWANNIMQTTVNGMSELDVTSPWCTENMRHARLF